MVTKHLNLLSRASFLLFSFFCLFCILSLSIPSAHAYDFTETEPTSEDISNYAKAKRNNPWFDSSKEDYEADVYIKAGVNAAKYNKGTLSYFINGLSVNIMGVSGETARVMVSQGQTPTPGAVNFLASGVSSMITSPPAKTAEYIADIGQRAGFISPAYAQEGTGWNALTPVLKVWQIFRNIAYAGFIIIFVIIGFMIMFRSKISSQAVVTIQAALPQIIVTLLLITFSYAIAAFVIDLIYLLIYLIIGIFGSAGALLPKNTQDFIFGQNIIQIAGDLIGMGGGENIAGTAADAMGDLVESLLSSSDILGEIANGLAYLIFAIAILISVFKLFFKLLMAYISIIFNVIFAPIILLFNALPGSQAFGGWLKGLLASALLFPATAILLIVAALITGTNNYGVVGDFAGYSGNAERPLVLPFIGGGIDAGAVTALIGLGMIMMLPNILEMIQKMMGVEGGVAGMAGAVLAPIATGAAVASSPYRAWNQERVERNKLAEQAAAYTTGKVTTNRWRMLKGARKNLWGQFAASFKK